MSHLLDCNEVDLLGYLTNHCCNKIEIHCLVFSTRFQKWVGLGFFSTLSNVNWLWLVSAVSYSFQLANQPWLLFFLYCWDAYKWRRREKTQQRRIIMSSLYVRINWIIHVGFSHLSTAEMRRPQKFDLPSFALRNVMLFRQCFTF